MAMDERLRVRDWPDIVEPRVSCSARAFSLTPSTPHLPHPPHPIAGMLRRLER